jgi:hypothetical protein
MAPRMAASSGDRLRGGAWPVVFISAVFALAAFALFVAGLPRWTFAVVATVAAIVAWLKQGELNASREREARLERTLTALREDPDIDHVQRLEARFRHLFGRPLRELERRGYAVLVEGDPAQVRVVRNEEVKAVMPLGALLAPERPAAEPAPATNGRFRPLEPGDAALRMPVTLEPSLERN